ncbi:SdrD B-like domain-containing protein [Polaribacter sp. R77954]|uniref:SdrD B-like domain-containing protein n=1 Tax=Polaribacter sp. R77954 TaxID=3093870 RepID=UPI0037C7C027
MKQTKPFLFMLIILLSVLNTTYAIGVDDSGTNTSSFYDAYQSNWQNVANFNVNTSNVNAMMFSSPTNVSCHNNGTLDATGDDFITFTFNPTSPSAFYENPYTYDVTATQNGSNVVIVRQSGAPATGIKYGLERGFNVTGATPGAGDVTITITPNFGAYAPINYTITDPGSCGVVCSSATNNSISYTYTRAEILNSNQFMIPQFEATADRTLTAVNVTYSNKYYSSVVLEGRDATPQTIPYTQDVVEQLILTGGATITNSFNTLSGTAAVSAAVLVPAQGSWPGDFGSGKSTAFRMIITGGDWLEYGSNMLGNDPKLHPLWVTNLTGNLTHDDDIYTGGNVTTSAGTENYSNAADLALFTGSGTVPFSLNYTSTAGTSGTGNVTQAFLIKGAMTVTIEYIYDCNNLTGSIGDTVWYDADGNGTQNGESGLEGATVTLDPGTPADASDDTTTTTDANGNYLFDNLPAGNYTVTVDVSTLTAGLPAGITVGDLSQTFDNDGTGTANTSDYTLAAGEDNLDQDFGYRAASTGSIGDTVWFDTNANGTQEAGEPGLQGATVTLDPGTPADASDDTTTTTDANGNYLFDTLPAGNYTVTTDVSTVTAGLPAGVTVADVTQTFDNDGIATANTSDVTLAQGQTNLDQDFAYTALGSIGDTVWYDADGNGAQNGESGLQGATVTLDPGTPADASDDVTTTTDANGNYLFANLPAGNYTVTVDVSTVTAGLPAGITVGNLSQTFDNDGTGTANTSDYTLAAGEDNLDQDFGYRAASTGSIGDTVWFDTNANGTQEAGEPGLQGATVTLDPGTPADASDDTTTTTDANGNYLFSNLPAGNYTVTTDLSTVTAGLPAGVTVADVTQTFDNDGIATANTSDVTLAQGQTNLDQDFAYTALGSIGDTVWYDADGNGAQNGESGLQGATVTLDPGTPLDNSDDTTTTTDANGNYLFDNLPAGNYTVTVDVSTVTAGLPAGITVGDLSQTFDNDGTGTANTSDYTLAAGEDNLDQDFGYKAASTGSIGDTVWFDTNANGTQEAGEPGLQGATVTLDPGTPLDNSDDITTTTDANGNYLFANLPVGNYTVTTDLSTVTGGLPAGVTVADLTQTFDNDGIATANTSDVTLAQGQTNLDQDFAYTALGSIGDTVWYDADGNGAQNGENGLQGATVTLDPGTPLDNSDDTTTTTDANGNYLFDNLPAGNYTVTTDVSTVTAGLPAGITINELAQTYDADGTGSANTSDYTLAAGEDNLDQDFGYQGLGSIGDTVWYDADGDAILDAGENGLQGATVTLDPGTPLDNSDDLTTTTSANGNYLFDNLPDGTYTVSVDVSTVIGGLPAGINAADLTQTYDADGIITANTSTLTLPQGQDNLEQDFAYQGLGSIGDTVWYDADGNGAQNGESGLQGATVTLDPGTPLDNSDDTTTTTDANGNYLFDNLPAGNYTVTVDVSTVTAGLPAGITVGDLSQTFDNDGTGTANTSDYTLAAGEDNLDQDFGYQGLGSIGDTIWYDTDADGIVDASENRLEGVTITLDPGTPADPSDDLTTTTDANGNYLFDNLPAGTYTVSVDVTTVTGGLPAGVTINELQQTYDADGIATPNTSDVILAAGEDNVNQDFGYQGLGSIGDTVWYDTDGDAILDAGENGLKDATVTLDPGTPGDISDDLTTTTTANGNYLFDNLPAGNYTITVDVSTVTGGLPAGKSVGDLSQTFDADGVSSANTSSLFLPQGQDNLEQDFAYVVPTGGTTGGYGGGIESESLGDALTKLYVGRKKNSVPTEFVKSNENLYNKAKMKSVQPYQGKGQTLLDMFPEELVAGNVANVTSPTDILDITIADEVLSVDFSVDGLTKGVVLGIKTTDKVYNHTKASCDRLRGAEILNIQKIQIGGYNFLMQGIKQRNGIVEYAISFATAKNNNDSKYTIQTNWYVNDYTKFNDVYNFQVWSTKPADTQKMVADILENLNGFIPVQQTEVQKFPETYASKIYREKGELIVALRSTQEGNTAEVNMVELYSETANNIKFRNNALTTEIQQALRLDIADGYEYDGLVKVDGEVSDAFYHADGNWGLDYDKRYTEIKNYFVWNDFDREYVDGEYTINRNPEVKAVSEYDYLTLYKALLPGTLSADYSEYKYVSFKAKGSGLMELGLIKASIEDWKAQYRVMVDFSEEERTYYVPFEYFSSSATQDKLTANDLTTLTFTFLPVEAQTKELDLKISDVKFTKTAVEDQIVAKIEKFENEFMAYPNPSKGKVNLLLFSETDTEATVTLSDVTGKVIYNQKVQLNAGKNELDFDFKVKTGVMLLKVASPENDYGTSKLIFR